MRRFAVLGTALAAAMVFPGCNLLTNQKNLFQGFEPDLTEQYGADVAGSKLLSLLDDDTESASFFEDLEDDPETRDTILNNLQDIIEDPGSSPEEKESAALFTGEIVLKTTPAGDVVNSLVDSLMPGGSSDETASGDTEVMEGIMAPVSDLDQEDFVVFVDTMIGLSSAYATVASTLPATGSSVSGDAAQAASVAFVLDAVVTNIVVADQNGDGDMQDEQAVALYHTIRSLEDDDPTNDLSLNLDSSFDLSASLLGGASGNDSNLEIILNSAGLGNLVDAIAQMGGDGDE